MDDYRNRKLSTDFAEEAFYISDWLGTKRVELGAGVCATTYFSLPYGDDLTSGELTGYASCVDATEHHYTGKQRDTESENDYFGARYYVSGMGRFLTPDEVRNDAHPANPQSWNLYAYVRNNPLSSAGMGRPTTTASEMVS